MSPSSHLLTVLLPLAALKKMAAPRIYMHIDRKDLYTDIEARIRYLCLLYTSDAADE